MTDAHVGGHCWGLPGLPPIPNSCELRGLCCRSCFGPRTCGRGINKFIEAFRGSESGFPLLRAGLGWMRGWLRRNVYDACSGCVVFFGISTYLSSWLVVLGDLVDVAAWGNVPCVSKIDTLGLFHSLLKSPTHAHTHTQTRTRPRAYACGRTLAARSSRQGIVGGDCPCRLCPVRNV